MPSQLQLFLREDHAKDDYGAFQGANDATGTNAIYIPFLTFISDTKMSSTITTTTTTQVEPTATLKLGSSNSVSKSEYKYQEYLPTFDPSDHYPPLTPFEHVDPASRALSHSNPRAFLDNAESVVEITPYLGSEVRGLNLVDLDSDGRDQLALEVRCESLSSVLNLCLT